MAGVITPVASDRLCSYIYSVDSLSSSNSFFDGGGGGGGGGGG